MNNVRLSRPEMTHDATSHYQPVHWILIPLPPSKDPDVMWHEDGAITLGDRTFLQGEEIDGHKFGGGFVAWRPTGRMQAIAYEFDGHLQTTEFDHHVLCGWRCFGTTPILVIKNIELEQCWLLKYALMSDGRSHWSRMTPVHGAWQWSEAVSQFQRLIELIVFGAVVAALYAVPTAVFWRVCQWAFGR